MLMLSIEEAAQRCGVDLSTLHPLTVEFTRGVASRLQFLPISDRKKALDLVVEALRAGGPDVPERVMHALSPEGGQS
jgi:hypothetical protein